MKKPLSLGGFAAWILLGTLNGQLPAFAQGTTAFTYQGRLNNAGGPANGSYDMTFAVWDANVAGDLIAGPLTNSAVAVSNGLFTVTLDFGPGVFTGTNYWVEMAVRATGAGSFSPPLVPRQQLTPAPYALSLVSPQATALNPAGAIIAFGGGSVPNGYLICDGRAVSRTTYANLFAAIGTAWGTGDGSSTFTLPDCRGVFLRGVDGGTGRDPDATSRSQENNTGNGGDAVGSYQLDALQDHAHYSWDNGGTAGGPDPNARGNAPAGNIVQNVDTTRTAGVSGGVPRVTSETRPKNVYVNYIIKY